VHILIKTVQEYDVLDLIDDMTGGSLIAVLHVTSCDTSTSVVHVVGYWLSLGDTCDVPR